jgi:hypothetical protein
MPAPHNKLAVLLASLLLLVKLQLLAYLQLLVILLLFSPCSCCKFYKSNFLDYRTMTVGQVYRLSDH